MNVLERAALWVLARLLQRMAGPMYFDKDGSPLKRERYCQLISQDHYREVAYCELHNGHAVSTVWLGLNHSHHDAGPPLIFETMVFPPGSLSELDCRRYSTIEEARTGHAELVTKWGLEP